MTEANTTIESKSNFFRWFTGSIIVLMIVLMVYSGNALNPQHREGGDGMVIGNSSAGEVNSRDTREATNLIDRLQTVHVVIPSMSPTAAPQLVPLLSAAWNEPVLRDLKANPEALALALRESRRVSPGVNPYALGPVEATQQSQEQLGMFNSGRVEIGQSIPVELRIVQRTGDGRMPEYAPTSLPPLEQANIHAAMQQFFMLQSAASLPLNAIKTTVPMIDRLIAQQFQTFTLQLAAVEAAPLLPKVPEPTDDQLRAQLAAYGAFEPGRVSLTNRFGHGYRIPDRVMIELISYKRADVRTVVEAEKSPYEWEVAARIAFARDPAAFAPTSQPATAPSTMPATAPAAATFEGVRDQVMAATIDKATDQRTADIDKAIRSPMAIDYQMWANATASRSGATTAPTTSPATSPAANAPMTSFGVTYDSPEYLRKLAAAVQAKFRVLPRVELYTDRFRDGRELSLLGGFNDATRELPPDLVRRTGRQSGVITGPEYAMNFSKDLLDAQALEFLGGLVLERYRPSERIESRRGENGREREAFLFRVTATERNHPATDIEPIRETLKRDWRAIEAQKLAAEQANAIVASINSGTEFTAAVNATAPGVVVTQAEVGPFHSPPADGKNLGLSMAAYAQFGTQVTERLLGEETAVATLDVPMAGKAYATKRLAMRGDWSSEEELRSLRQGLRARFATQMTLPKSETNPIGVSTEDVAATWLNSKRIFERVGYKPLREDGATD